MPMEAVRAFFKKDQFAAHSGIRLVSVAAGEAVAEMSVEPYHCNGVGIAHGGAIFTLADFAFAAASNSHGTVAVAITASISFLKAVESGAVLRAAAREVACGGRVGTYSIEVTSRQGDRVALFQGTVYRKNEPLPV